MEENKDEKISACYVLSYVFKISMKLLHPFMPYVTEEIYQMLPVKDNESIMISSYPKYQSKFIFEDVEKIVDDQLLFDYKLKKGVAKEGNAIKILELCGYPSSLIRTAKNTLPMIH